MFFTFFFERMTVRLPCLSVREFVHGQGLDRGDSSFQTDFVSMPVDVSARPRLQEFVQQEYFSPRTMGVVHCVTTQVRVKR